MPFVMASSSSFKRLGAGLAFAAAGKVAAESYTLTDEYTASNFFEKFDFYVSSGDVVDPTHGFVNYRNQADAEDLGLISSSNGQIYIGPDTNQTYSTKGNGRDSVRIMSKAKYNQGLMIAKFSHMPVQSCGSWPAFWSYGSPWLSSGEIDYYEGWNDLGHNVMALHTNLTIAGECLLTTANIAAEVTTPDCNDEKIDESIGQYVGTGCGVSDTAGVWGSTTGATFAMQWVDDAIKIWNWLPDNVPSDITAGTPDPDANTDSWGQPQLLVENDSCDLASAFSNQQLVFNIDFCGDTAGNSVLWADTCSAMGPTCVDYVASTPSAFSETYFMIEGIQFYETGAAASSASASASTVVATSVATTSATVPAETSGILSGINSVLGSALGVSATVDVSVAAAATTTHSHTTSYVTGTSTTTNEKGETTVVVVVDTTICPVTAAEASESSVLATASTLVPAQTTATSKTSAIATTPASSVPVVASTSVATSVIEESSTLTSVQMTTSTIFATHISTIASCHSLASACKVGDETTVVVALSTTICPVTAAEASESSVLATATSETSAVATTPVASVEVLSSTTSIIEESSTLTSVELMTSTLYSTHTSTIASCHSLATACNVGDVTTVVVAHSTTICPVTAAEASQSTKTATNVGSASGGIPPVVGSSAVRTSAVQASSSAIVPSASKPVTSAVRSSSAYSMTKATSKTAAVSTSSSSSEPLAAQSTYAKSTTISKPTKSEAATSTAEATQTSESALVMATGTPTESSVSYGDATETLSVTSSSASYSSGSGTTAGAASSTAASASPINTCGGIDCIVVSNSGSRSSIGASGIALAAVAGAVFLF